TATLADGLYDLRAIGYDSLGNASTASVRANVRFDNTAPQLVSSTPADGSVSAAAGQIVLNASEPVTVIGALLDGAAAPAPAVSGTTLTFATGLSDGLHVLSGELEDASGARIPFRVAVTIESAPGADRPPVELSARASADSTLTAPSSLASVTLPPAAWPTRPTASDFVVLRIDLSPPPPSVGPGLLPGTQLVEVTAFWGLAGTAVTEFEAPIDVVIPNPSGEPVLPSTSQTGASWRTLARLAGPALPASQRDGYYLDGGGSIHILTRHLTYYSLLRDNEAPTAPRHIAGVVADDGLTIRWIPGTDSSGQLGNVLLYVNGEEYRFFGPTEFEAKMGAFSPTDTRTFTLAQLDAAGNRSPQTPPLRAVPELAGRGLAEATAALAAAGFSVGSVREETSALYAPGTVIDPADLRLAVESTAIDLVIARSPGTSPQTRLIFAVAGSKKLALKKQTTIPLRVKVSRPAVVTATLFGTKKQRLYTWRLKVKAGATVLKLRLPRQIRQPGTYTISLVARSGSETIRRALKVNLMSPKLAQARPRKQPIEVVLTGKTKHSVRPGRSVRFVAQASPDETFALAASASRNIGVVVVDVDAYGTALVGDLHMVFPALRLIAIAREPAVRSRSLRAGAGLALPRSTSAQQLAAAIVRIAGR
ncbi:MAG TPA: Ig-like domain-containing protein, partial [Gaiellaceae bacterium]